MSYPVCKIKNLTGGSFRLREHTFESDELWQIPDLVRLSWIQDIQVHSAIDASSVQVYEGNAAITDKQEQKDYLARLFDSDQTAPEIAIFSMGKATGDEYMELGQASPGNLTPYIIDGTRNRMEIFFSNQRTVGNSDLIVKKITNVSPFATSDLCSVELLNKRFIEGNTIYTIDLYKGDKIVPFIDRRSGTKAKEVWIKLKMWSV